MSDEVLFNQTGGLGRITLNRPKAINSLTTAMCAQILAQLETWAVDDSITAVAVTGAGDRGLCAGGDVKALRQEMLDNPDGTASVDFWEDEYQMNAAIVGYPKPYLAIMNGATMGGGLGVSAHGSHRLVTNNSKLAMPETIIGFFPDVGMLKLLADAPGEYGTHLAMTGSTIDAAHAIAAGLADTVLDPAGPEDVEELLAGVATDPSVLDDLPRSPGAELPGWVDECYTGDDAAAIVERLRTHGDPDAAAAADLIEARSPFAVTVTLAAIRRAAGASTAQVLAQDLKLCQHFRSEPDFAEGVRCQLVDRGDTPQWRHASLAEVDPAEVAALF